MSFAQDNFKIVQGFDLRFTTINLVASGAAATIAEGTPSKSADAAGAATGAVVPMVDGDGTIAQSFTGICKDTSTDTASAAGVVTLWTPIPGIVYSGVCKTTSANTAAKVLALFRKRVVYDLTSSLWTVDAAATDALVNCVTIIGGDFNVNTVFFVYKPAGTYIDQHQTS